MPKTVEFHKMLRLPSALLMAAVLCACKADTSPTTDTQVENQIQTDRDLTMNGLVGVFQDAGAGAPVMLLVPGSGPTDMDGNSPQGIRTNTYLMLADGLKAEGVSTLRVDKRGMFKSVDGGDANNVTVDLYAQDYRDWAAYLRKETGQDCVYLAGHSEGGTMASAAVVLDSDGICGLILLAAPGRPYADILRDQLQSNPANAPVLSDAMSAIAVLERGETVDATDFHPALQGLFAPQVQKFLISLFTSDPADLVREANVPTLVLQGSTDIQVSIEDAQRLEAAGGTLALLPGVNHVLKTAPADRAGNLATYADPDLPLAETVVPTIVDFIEN